MSYENITVCICTYQRPEMLRRLLEAVEGQYTAARFGVSALVVDNDCDRTAASVVSSFCARSSVPVRYECEPRKNISRARNTALRLSAGDYVAFIDDDEVPSQEWLLRLYETIKACTCAGVLGPVEPLYDSSTPEWLKQSGLLKRTAGATGQPVASSHARTGNVLFTRQVVVDPDLSFEERLGTTGGEDSAFFEKAIGKGYRFVWSREAVVYEAIPAERTDKLYYFKRRLRIGNLSGEKIRRLYRFKALYLVKYTLLLYLCSAAYPFSFLLKQGVQVLLFVKLGYYLGWFAGFFGLEILRDHE